MIGDAEVTASHCLNGGYRDGFLFDGDVATTAAVDWVDVGSVPVGSTVWAIGYPFSLRPDRVEYTLSALHTQVVEVYGVPQLVLMTKGSGTPCLSGASGMIAWASVDGLLQPIGPLSVGSIDPQVTGLPAGQFVCGFAIPMKGTS